MREQTICGWLAAATLTAALAFAGNDLWEKTKAASPPPEQEMAQTQPETTEIKILETEPVTAATVPPPDPELVARLEAAAEAMDGTHIFVYDLESGQMLYCSTARDELLYPASITKLYAAWLALQYLEPETVVTAGEELALVEKGSSLAYISRGDALTVEMLIEGMLLPSGNDAAYVLAAAAGREIAGDPSVSAEKAVAAFLSEMNREAFRLGMVNSNFTNPDGFHAGDHYSCPEDLALIGTLALEEPVITRYAGLYAEAVTFETGEKITWYNTNSLVNPGSDWYEPAAVGLKTGYTGEAGHCLLAAFEEGDDRWLVGIFGAEEKLSRYKNAAALWQCRGQ